MYFSIFDKSQVLLFKLTVHTLELDYMCVETGVREWLKLNLINPVLNDSNFVPAPNNIVIISQFEAVDWRLFTVNNVVNSPWGFFFSHLFTAVGARLNAWIFCH